MLINMPYILLGILLVFLAGTFLNWSQLAFLGGVLPIPFLILMLIIPETPRWYYSILFFNYCRSLYIQTDRQTDSIMC